MVSTDRIGAGSVYVGPKAEIPLALLCIDEPVAAMLGSRYKSHVLLLAISQKARQAKSQPEHEWFRKRTALET